MKEGVTSLPEQYHNRWFVLASVGSGVFLATLDGSIVNVSLPDMVSSLNTTFATIQWVVLAYLLTVTTLMLGFGRLGDIVGKKRIYMLGFGFFTFASLLCGLSEHVYHLIAFRVLQGCGAAMIMALGAAIVTEAFPPMERGKAMGTIGAIVSIGIVSGPALGGIIVDTFSWNWIFFVNLPIGCIGLFFVYRVIPDIKPSNKQAFDYMGAIILFLSLSTLLLGLTLGQQKGFSESAVLILLPVSCLTLFLFVWSQLKIRQPMINLSLFTNPLLSISLFTGFLSFVGMGGIFILVPFYLKVILGYSTVKVGLLMCIIPVMMGIFSPISGTLSDRFGSRVMTILGLCLMVFGYFVSSGFDLETDTAGYVIRILWVGIGIGLFLSPNNSAIMGAGSKSQLGVVSGLMAISRTLGQTVGVSVIGAVWAVKIRMVTGNWQLADVSRAPVTAQMQGLNFVFLLVAGIICIALCVGIYGYYLEKKIRLAEENKPERIN